MTILEIGEYQATVPDGNSEIMDSEMPGECQASNLFSYLPISVLKYEFNLSIFDNLREHLPQGAQNYYIQNHIYCKIRK